MIRFPALNIGGRIIKGNRDDSHNSLGARLSIGHPAEHQRGFSPDGKLFLTRHQAIGFLKKHDRRTYNNLPKEAQQGLHSEHLASAYGIEQRPEKGKADVTSRTVYRPEGVKETTPRDKEPVELSTKTA